MSYSNITNEEKDKIENKLSYLIRGSIFKVYQTLGPGLLESIYEEALVYQLRQDGLDVSEQVDIPIQYNGHTLKTPLRLDILVENKVIVELKSVEMIKEVYFKQLKSYLILTGLKLGLLVNFNTDNINNSIKRVVNGL